MSYKLFIGAKALCIWFKKIDGFIKINDGIRYLVLSGSKQFNAIHNRIRYLIREKGGITDIIIHNFARVRIDLYNYFLWKKH